MKKEQSILFTLQPRTSTKLHSNCMGHSIMGSEITESMATQNRTFPCPTIPATKNHHPQINITK